MTTGIEALKRAINEHFDGNMSATARAIGVTPQAVSDKLRNETTIAPEWALKIEAATEGKISRSDLRPDLWPTKENTNSRVA
jgi:DNA-binding transcriptional regulator YdaS (Cro superfamily)